MRLKYTGEPYGAAGRDRKADSTKEGMLVKLKRFAVPVMLSGALGLGGCWNSKPAYDSDSFCRPPTEQTSDTAKKLLVLTRESLASDKLCDYITKRRAEGFAVKVITAEEIPQSGNDVPESIRNFLKQEKETNGLDYLLIIGDVDPDDYSGGSLEYDLDKEWEVPMRYVSIRGKPYEEGPGDWEGEPERTIIPTDQYYASLNGNWDSNGNGIYGEAGVMEDEFDFKLDVAVGRIPVRNTNELEKVLGTIISWQPKERPAHSVFHGMYCNASYSEGTREWAYGGLLAEQVPEVKDVRLHMCYNDSGGDMAGYVNSDGADFVTSASHGGFDRISLFNAGGTAYGYKLDSASAKIEKAPIFFAYACLTAAIDRHEDVLAEYLLKSGQVVAYIGATRSNADIRFDFWSEAYFSRYYNLGDAFYGYKQNMSEMKVLADGEKENFMIFNLFGDPTLQISEKPKAVVSVPQAFDVASAAVAAALINTAQNGMTITIGYSDPLTPETGIFNGYIEPASPASFTFEHGIENPLLRYRDGRIIVRNDYDGAVAVSRVIFFSNHLVKGPIFVSKVREGEEVAIPVWVLYGTDETVMVKAEFVSGYYPETSEGAERFEIFSGTFDLALERKIPVTIVVPENTRPYVDGMAYHMPKIEFSCDGCSSAEVTFVSYVE